MNYRLKKSATVTIFHFVAIGILVHVSGHCFDCQSVLSEIM